MRPACFLQDDVKPREDDHTTGKNLNDKKSDTTSGSLLGGTTQS